MLRFGLGVMEAGFLPGIAVYLTKWFPLRYRARAVGGYIVAGSFSAVLGGPISTTIMTYINGPLGLQGWQWMFVLEGLPAILLGILTLRLLTERPADAAWLTPGQRTWLEDELEAERAALGDARHPSVMQVAGDPRVWSLAGLFGCALVGIYGLFLWLPQIVKELGDLSTIQIGFLSAGPPLMGVLGTYLISRSSDRTGDRKKHLAFVYAMSALAITGSAFSPSPLLAYILLCVTGLFIYAGNPLFWSLASSFRTGAAGAATIALINTIAQFGGLVGPWSIGLVRKYTGDFHYALLTIAAFLVVSVVIALLMRVAPPERAAALPAGSLPGGPDPEPPMIIDIHGHYTTSPKEHEAWRAAQIEAVKSGAPVPPYPAITDEQIRTSIEAGQIRLQRERGTDLTIFSPRAAGMGHHLSTAEANAAWSTACNDLIARVCQLFPRNFVGVGQLPQAPGVAPANCLPELRRCVQELGFVGVNLNPDPSGGYWTDPPLTDRWWYPVYETLVELDVPAMIHVSSSCNPNFHGTGAHYINGDTSAFMQLIEGDLFADFPALRFVIPHGGGAVPFHWGRYRGLAQDDEEATAEGPPAAATCSSTPASITCPAPSCWQR